MYGDLDGLYIDNLWISMDSDGDSEFMKMFAPLDFIGYFMDILWIL